MMQEWLEAVTNGQVTSDEAHGRIYGWLQGIVTDIDAPTKQVKARIGKQGDNESTDWLVPIGMGSIESLPEVGDPVGVMFMDGDVHRGAYFYFPQSNTTKRPTEPVPLGTSLVGLINFMATQLNQLRTDFNTLCTSLATHTHSGVTAGAGASGAAVGITPVSTSASPAKKGKASDGSVVSDGSSSVVVLSKRSLVR